MGFYSEPPINKIKKEDHWFCPFCDSKFATEKAFDIHQKDLGASGWQCFSATERENMGLIREHQVWSVVEVPVVRRRRNVKT